jgi:hypothetical protein
MPKQMRIPTCWPRPCAHRRPCQPPERFSRREATRRVATLTCPRARSPAAAQQRALCDHSRAPQTRSESTHQQCQKQRRGPRKSRTIFLSPLDAAAAFFLPPAFFLPFGAACSSSSYPKVDHTCTRVKRPTNEMERTRDSLHCARNCRANRVCASAGSDSFRHLSNDCTASLYLPSQPRSTRMGQAQ